MILGVLYLFPLGAKCQELDSIASEKLPEIVVKAQMQHTDASSSTYTPTTRQKTSAQNAIDLLRQLAIPQININLVDNAVTTPSGQNVAVYINYIPASAEEIEGLLTSDVRRVEYLDFPTDPRFQGNEHVVNFIMQQYEYGGYTKALINENFLVGKLSSRASIYSKFAYKRMTYDLYAGASNHDIKHTGASIIGDYILENTDGEPYHITRNEIFNNSHYKYNQYPVTFRAIYDSDNVQIANTVGFNFDQSPAAETSGCLSYKPAKTEEYSYNRCEPYTSRYLVWSGNYYFILPRNFHLSVSPGINYGHTNNTYLYQTSGTDVIVNESKENVWQFRGSATLYKKFTDRQNGFFRAWYGSISNDVSYFGSSPYDNDFLDTYAGAALGYNISNNKWNISTDVALQWEKNKINDQSVSEIYPLLNVSAGFSPSQKHSLRAYFHFGANYPGASEKTPNTLQQNELMYYTGNPELGLSRQVTFNLSYNWMPSNKFSVLAFAQYFGEYNLYVPVYKPYNNGMALLRKFETDGDYNRTQIGMSFNYKLLNGNLQFAASPSISFYRMTGLFDIERNPFSCNVSATYYLGNFYFQTSYQTGSLTVQGNHGVIYKDRDFYQIIAGWSRANWNIRVSAMNLFRNDWLCATNTLSTPLYSETRFANGNNFHRRLNLSIIYTFGYGKKVQRGNEVGVQSGASSAIMK
ncbi:hypothetical protein GAX96_02425 [Phocaeicola vulgatus]|uniref:Outer membrane protein beta-barrel domain-containing protein n=1 Tax=Phocaeicola vulgatus TaxID=821 RepID=A0A6I1BRN0_PHOVU|nr:hypothetical protein GAY14_05230 [Phocaeicola vulgatus]KAB3558186.1 hypothetical protein GAX95_03680 [Phocaeicola vulgatus]KAB3560232.1 hypothetical protein GAY65_05560 [Phocaeicola vulgatus]KAB3570083.1 hypothetical protein GAX92_02805 [Phocaeicola vulgatus]KAB3571482.1 hypothetical protein GAX99_02395 [Phocaeicola vulgatus]